jgi:hypothetical protein
VHNLRRVNHRAQPQAVRVAKPASRFRLAEALAASLAVLVAAGVVLSGTIAPSVFLSLANGATIQETPLVSDLQSVELSAESQLAALLDEVELEPPAPAAETVEAAGPPLPLDSPAAVAQATAAATTIQPVSQLAPPVASVRSEAAQPVAQATPTTIVGCTIGGSFTRLFGVLGEELVGRCLESETLNLESGDASQRTTRGLLVWVNANNVPAFTNGELTWYGCSNGVERRSPNQPFPCAAQVNPTPVPTT